MSKTTLTFPTALPRVPRGTIVQMRDGRLYFVKKQTATTLTVVPYRWWHGTGIWWKFLLGLLFGTLISQGIVHWEQLMRWLAL